MIVLLRRAARSRVRLPTSTAGQMAAIVVGATVLAHLLSVVIWLSTRDGVPPELRSLGERVDTIARICPALSRSDCLIAAQGLAHQHWHVGWLDAPPAAAAPEPDSPRRLEAELDARLASGAARVTAAGGQGFALDIGGVWLGFAADESFARREHPPLTGVALLLLATGLPLLALTLWAVRQVTNPLAELARASARVGQADAPVEVSAPLPEGGTREVRQLAFALNGLLDRLRRFVSDRTRMLAAVSHDLRTPLTRIRLRAEGVEDEALRYRLLKDVRTMELMIGASLSLLESQERREREESVDLAALLQTICDEFADSGFDVLYAGPLRCPARCRPLALERALNNVIDNALKFGGSARVALACGAEGLRIDIEDDGPGIPDDEKRKVTESFYQARTERGGGGSGLGLAIASTIVTTHGGALALEDRAPTGLRVRLTLPR